MCCLYIKIVYIKAFSDVLFIVCPRPQLCCMCTVSFIVFHALNESMMIYELFSVCSRALSDSLFIVFFGPQ